MSINRKYSFFTEMSALSISSSNNNIIIERINKRKVFYINKELKRTIVLVKDENLGVQPFAYFAHNKEFLDRLVTIQTEVCARLSKINLPSTSSSSSSKTAAAAAGNEAERLVMCTDPIIRTFNKNSVNYFYAMQLLRRSLPLLRESDLLKKHRYQITFFYNADEKIDTNTGKLNIILVLDNCLKVKKPRSIPYERLFVSLFTETDLFLCTGAAAAEMASGGDDDYYFTLEATKPCKYIGGKTLGEDMSDTLKKVPFVAASDLQMNKYYPVVDFNFLKPCEQPVIGRAEMTDNSYVVIMIKWSKKTTKLVMCHPNVFCMLRSAAAYADKPIFISKSEIADTIRTAIKIS